MFTVSQREAIQDLISAATAIIERAGSLGFAVPIQFAVELTRAQELKLLSDLELAYRCLGYAMERVVLAYGRTQEEVTAETDRKIAVSTASVTFGRERRVDEEPDDVLQ